MHSNKLTTIAIALATAGLSSATCVMNNAIDGNGGHEDRSELCTPQAQGNYQLALDTSEVGVPTFDGDNAFAGVTGNYVFILFDSLCNRVGVYSPTQDNDCGVPYEIDYLISPITIDRVDFDVGSPYFRFQYNGQTYSVDDAKCGGCGDLSHDVYAEEACKCGFYADQIQICPPDTLC